MVSYFATLFFCLSIGLSAANAHAWTEKALGSTDAFVISPNDLSTDFFRLDTKLPWSWVPGSFDWVRVDHRMLVPRARVKIAAAAGTPVRYRGRVSFANTNEVELLVVLTQERGNEIEIDHQA
ncbi:MAG: hypothetical protein H7333_09885 [Bdellovibrionales bacterium]|nr:hypothetical protein [Oligoflexia bacterium]